MPTRKYNTARALKQAINSRLRKIADTKGIGMPRLYRQLAFERLLARIFSNNDCPLLLKGGYAMELRTSRARNTKDLDLSMFEQQLESIRLVSMHNLITEAASLDLGDYFVFEVTKSTRPLAGPPHGGARFHVNAKLDGRSLTKFHLDVGVGEARIEPAEYLDSANLLSFAGFDCSPFPSISREQQFAEKIHAYTSLHRGKMGSRVKDLIDMVLLITESKLNHTKLLKSLQLTFQPYNKQPPSSLPKPPSEWKEPFAQLAAECQLETNIDEAYELVAKFLKEPVF